MKSNNYYVVWYDCKKKQIGEFVDKKVNKIRVKTFKNSELSKANKEFFKRFLNEESNATLLSNYTTLRKDLQLRKKIYKNIDIIRE